MEYNIIKTPEEYALTIAGNLRKRRKGQKLSQEALAKKSGVSLGSLKRFESTGQISLQSLLKIALVLDCVEAFDELFRPTKIRSIQEIINGEL